LHAIANVKTTFDIQYPRTTMQSSKIVFNYKHTWSRSFIKLVCLRSCKVLLAIPPPMSFVTTMMTSALVFLIAPSRFVCLGNLFNDSSYYNKDRIIVSIHHKDSALIWSPYHIWKLCCCPLNILTRLENSQNQLSHPCRKRNLAK
jgi:hypothetical protein